MITTQKELRNTFWADHPQFRRTVKVAGRRPNGDPIYIAKEQNDYPTDIRMAWCDYVEHMRRDNQITENLAQRATL